MTHAQTTFDDLLDRVRAGDAAALAELVAHYEYEVRLAARARLGPPLQPYLDSVDLVQSVHRSLLMGLRNNRFDISTPDNLLGLALTIVRRKVARHWRRLRRQQRESGFHNPSEGLSELLVGLHGRLQDPAQAAALKDATERALREFGPSDRQLIELRLEGYSTVEATARLGLDPDVTRARLSRLRKRLREAGLEAELI